MDDASKVFGFECVHKPTEVPLLCHIMSGPVQYHANTASLTEIYNSTAVNPCLCMPENPYQLPLLA